MQEDPNPMDKLPEDLRFWLIGLIDYYTYLMHFFFLLDP